MKALLEFLALLNEKGIEHRLEQQRPKAVMITFAMPGVRVEVEFFEDNVEYSVFKGDESVFTDKSELHNLIARHWSD